MMESLHSEPKFGSPSKTDGIGLETFLLELFQYGPYFYSDLLVGLPTRSGLSVNPKNEMHNYL